MAWMETDSLKTYAHFRWKIKWRLEHLGAQRIMGQTATLNVNGSLLVVQSVSYLVHGILDSKWFKLTTYR